MESLNSFVIVDIKLATKNISAKKIPDTDGFTGKFRLTFKENLKPILHKLF